MRTYIILFSLIAVAVILYIVKTQVDNRLSNEVSLQLEDVIHEIEYEDDVEIFFEDVHVNSLAMSMKVSNLEITVENTDIIMMEELTIGMSHKEIINFLKTKEFNKLESFDVEIKQPSIEFERYDYYSDRKKTTEIQLADYISIDFNGLLTQNMVDNFIEGRLPRLDQVLSIEAKGVNIEEYADAMEIKDTYEGRAVIVGTKSDFGCTFEFLPSTKQMKITNLFQKNEYGNSSINILSEYKGTKVDNFSIKDITITSGGGFDFNTTKVELPVTDYSGYVGFILNDFNHNLNYSMKGDILNIEYLPKEEEDHMFLNNTNFNYDVSINDFGVEIPNAMIREIKNEVSSFLPELEDNVFHINLFESNMEYDEGMFVGNLNLDNSLCNINAEFEIEVTSNDAWFKKCEIEISEMLSRSFIKDVINGIFIYYEDDVYRNLPKNDDGDLLISVSGNSNELRLKLRRGYLDL